MIELERLTKRYGELKAVDGVSLEVKKGELLALVGGSGCGKTTTLKMINRLIEPSSGRILIDGEDVSRLRPFELRRRIGYVFQRIGLFPHLTIAENVTVPLTLAVWKKADIAARVTELLELVELDPALRNRFPNELSGGQQQRVGVARALAARPKLMLLDEPFGALDPITRDRLGSVLTRIKQELELTAILVTHDMLEALLLADRIAVMRTGRLIQVGTPDELLSKPADRYVVELLEMPRRQARALDQLGAGA